MEQDSKPPPRPHPRQPAKPRTRPSKKPGPDSESKSAKTKRRRDLQRLLERSTRLPADVRIEHERELASLSHDLQRTRRQEKGYKIARRYKMVRLFERKRATRLLKKASTACDRAQDEGERRRLAENARACEIDLNYTIYCPIFQPYSSLYAAGVKDDKDLEGAECANRSTRMWGVVERCTAEGKDALERLRVQDAMPSSGGADQRRAQPQKSRNRKQPVGSKPGPRSKKAFSTPAERAKRGSEGPAEDEEDGDDGMGFFET